MLVQPHYKITGWWFALGLKLASMPHYSLAVHLFQSLLQFLQVGDLLLHGRDTCDPKITRITRQIALRLLQ